MSNEISQEAQASIAQLNQRMARDRLARDGAHSNDALRRRVRAFAGERNLPPADIAKLMYKRINTRDVMLFCEKHKVSYDWLLCGDLKGLARMERERKQAAAAASHSGGPSGYFLKIFCGLDENQQSVALAVIHKLATEKVDD